jgi:hypothetical protein
MAHSLSTKLQLPQPCLALRHGEKACVGGVLPNKLARDSTACIYAVGVRGPFLSPFCDILPPIFSGY